MKKISVVIPCYYSEKSLAIIVNDAIKTIKNDGRYDYEVILVNDGSKDGTWSVIEQLASSDDKVVGINLSKNFGQHSALIAGYRVVTGDIILGVDDDGEHDPKEMFKLIDKLEEGYDYVAADYSDVHKKASAFRNFGTWLNELMAKALIDLPKDVTFSSYYVERRFVTEEIAKCSNPFPYILGLLLQVTHNIGNVKLAKHQRLYGKSGYNYKKLLSLWLNGFTAFSVKPLRLSTVFGFLVSFIGFILGIYIIVNKIVNPNVQLGWSSLMCMMFFMGGIVMLMLGMIGEYIGRVYININNKPQYVIKEKIN